MARWSSLLAVVFGAAVTFAAGSARADLISSCGGAVFNGNESCTVDASVDCTAACQPPQLEVACSAMLEANCTGGCTASLPSCQTSCTGGCSAKCSASGGYSCTGDCSATCEGNCAGECMGMGNMAQCTAECQASCGARCDVSCKGSPPMAGCAGQCDLSCQGSCTGQANLACDISCQANLSANCTAMLQGGCQAKCNAHSAIFCNGNFINAADANACVNDLKNLFHIQVSGWAYANSGCDGGTCTANAAAGGKASASCDVAPGAPPLSGAVLALGLGGALAGVIRRRGNAKKS